MKVGAALSSSDEGDDAEGAHVVASSHYGDVCCDTVWISSNGIDICVCLLCAEGRIHGLVSKVSGGY